MSNPLLAQVLQAIKANTQKSAISFFNEVVDYCESRETGKMLPDCPRSRKVALIAYHFAKGTLATSRDPNGEINGLLMWYRCKPGTERKVVKDWLTDTDDFNFLFAYAYSDGDKALRSLILNTIQIDPDCLVSDLVWYRHKGKKRREVKTDIKFIHKALKMKGNNGTI